MTAEERRLLAEMLDKTNPNREKNQASPPEFYLKFADETRSQMRQVPTREGSVMVDVIAAENRKLPGAVFVYYYGGGFVNEHGERNTWFCRRLAAELGITVIDVYYTTTKTAPFPRALHECYDVVKWVKTHAEELDVDPEKIFVGGGSSGANLAVSTALLNKKNREFEIAKLILIYPGFRMDIDPAEKQAENVTRLRIYQMLYAETPEIAGDPLVSAGLAPDEMLEEFPETLFIVAGKDYLVNETKEFMKRLIDVNVSFEARYYPESVHGFVARWYAGYNEAILDIELSIKEKSEQIDSRKFWSTERDV